MDGAAELEQILQPPRERGQQRRVVVVVLL